MPYFYVMYINYKKKRRFEIENKGIKQVPNLIDGSHWQVVCVPFVTWEGLLHICRPAYRSVHLCPSVRDSVCLGDAATIGGVDMEREREIERKSENVCHNSPGNRGQMSAKFGSKIDAKMSKCYERHPETWGFFPLRGSRVAMHNRLGIRR